MHRNWRVIWIRKKLEKECSLAKMTPFFAPFFPHFQVRPIIHLSPLPPPLGPDILHSRKICPAQRDKKKKRKERDHCCHFNNPVDSWLTSHRKRIIFRHVAISRRASADYRKSVIYILGRKMRRKEEEKGAVCFWKKSRASRNLLDQVIIELNVTAA